MDVHAEFRMRVFRETVFQFIGGENYVSTKHHRKRI